MTRRAITAPDLRPPAGAYSHAIAVGDTLYCAGQLGRDPATGRLEQADVAAQTERALANLAAIYRAANADLAQAAQLTLFLTDLTSDSSVVDAVIAGTFPADPPARTVVGVTALPAGARVKIAAIVALTS